MSASFLVVGSSFLPFLFPFHLPFFLPGWPGWIIPSAVSPIVVSRVAVLRAAVFRTASGTAAPVLRRHYLCRPVCPARWVHGFCCPDAIPLACLLSGYRMPAACLSALRVPDASRLPVCSPGGGAACRSFSLVPDGAFSAPASPGLRGNTMSFSPAPQPLRAVIPFSSSRRPCRLPSRSP